MQVRPGPRQSYEGTFRGPVCQNWEGSLSLAGPGLCLTDRETKVLELELGGQPKVSDSQGLLSSTILHQIPVPLCLDVFFHSFNVYGLSPNCQTLLGPANFVSLKSLGVG